MINDDQLQLVYHYQDSAVYATLILKVIVYNKPFTSLKKLVNFIFSNFRDNIIFFGTPGQSIKIQDCPVQSGTYGMYANSKAFANDKSINKSLFSKAFFFRVIKRGNFLIRGKRIENIMGKGENIGYQHFLLLLLCFQKP